MVRPSIALRPFLDLGAFPSPLSARDAARRLLLRLVGLPWSQAPCDGRDLARPCDWDYFLSLGARHRVAPVLHARLAALRQAQGGPEHGRRAEGALEDAVPERVREALAGYHATTLTRNVLLLSETESFCERLHRHGIPVMLLKGVALLPLDRLGAVSMVEPQGVYPHPALRPMTDVDILIHKRDVPAARRILESECGYRDAGIESPAGERVYGRTTLHKPDAPGRLGRVLLEVHWDIVPLEYEWKGRRPPTAEFWAGANEVRLGEAPAFAPNDADHLCYIAMHNCVHGFDRLMGLMDVAYLYCRLRRSSSWDPLVRCATTYRCRVDLFLNLALAQGLFGVPCAPAALQELAPAEWRARLLARLFTPEAIFDEKFSPVRRCLIRALSADHLGDALRLLVWSVFPSETWLAHKAELGKIPGARNRWLGHLVSLAGHARDAVRSMRRGR